MYHTVYTAGYLAGWTPAGLLAAAETRNAIIVDIRMQPASRKPGWSGQALSAALPSGRYGWLRAFGNVNYRGGAIVLHDPERGIERLTPILQRQPVILLCACREVAGCHRRVVAELLRERLGVQVEHMESPQ